MPGLDFLCRLFWGPDSRLCQEMILGGFNLVFDPLKPMLSKGALTAAKAFEAFLAPASDSTVLCRELHITYARLFLTGRGETAIPLYQSCYLFDEAPLMGPPALRMRDRLSAAGLVISGHGNEPPDHLAVELEYLYFLLSKGLENQDAQTPQEAADFAGSELSQWLPTFSDRVTNAAGGAPYDYAAVMTRELVQLIVR